MTSIKSSFSDGNKQKLASKGGWVRPTVACKIEHLKIDINIQIGLTKQ